MPGTFVFTSSCRFLLLGLIVLAAIMPAAVLGAGAPGPLPPAEALDYSVFLSDYPAMEPFAIAVGTDYSLYITGVTTNRPRPDGAPFTGKDVFVARLSPDGRRLTALTYLVGSGDESAYGIAVDGRGAVYLAGQTNSADLPTRAAAQPAYAGAPFVRDKMEPFSAGDGDAFVARLDPDGRTWGYITYLGGSATDKARGIAVDAAGNAAVIGTTFSADFPRTGGLQTDLAGPSAAFIAQFTPGGRLRTSALLGEAGKVEGVGIARDPTGRIYGVLQHVTDRLEDNPLEIRVVSLHPNGSLYYRTDLGGAALPPAIAADTAGRAYIVLPRSGPPEPGSIRSNYQATVIRLAADGRSVEYERTYSGREMSDLTIVVSPEGEAVVAGTTNSPEFPTPVLPAHNRRGNFDMFVIRLDSDGLMRWGARLGGSSYDYHATLARDRRGRVYVAGWSSSEDFPITHALPGGTGTGVVARLRPEGAPLPVPIFHSGFAELWARSDLPVALGASGAMPRGWVWGPEPISHGMPHHHPFEQYFEKGGMSTFSVLVPGSPSPLYLEDFAAPRLVVELIDPEPLAWDAYAVWDTQPCAETVAGDPRRVNPAPVTYETLRSVAYPVVVARAEPRPGATVTALLQPDGTVSDDPMLARYGVTLGGYDERIGHNVPSIFLEFVNRRGLIYVDGHMVEGPILGDWTRMVGLPLSEPYWIRTFVGGVERDVLIQPFERRVLTYTPANAPPWQVEFANVGRHYVICHYPGRG